MVIKKCLVCGKKFKIRLSPSRIKENRGKYCSGICYHLSRITQKKKNCLFCGKEFFGRKSRKYCSRYCLAKNTIASYNNFGENHPNWTGGKIKTICNFCKNEFKSYKSDKRKYCSKSCATNAMIGVTGERCNHWKGGTTKDRQTLKYYLWRKSVWEKDNFTCQKTGIIGKKLHAHHIQNFAQYPELRFAIDNGITLSEKAHREFHKIYGRTNNTKEQIIGFLKEQTINIKS